MLEVSRGLAKTLDHSQVNFFKNEGNKNIDTNAILTQMLTLQNGSDTYYLDTSTGYIYDKDFMDEGYKDKLNGGQSTVIPAIDNNGQTEFVDAVGRLDLSNTDYYDNNGTLIFKVSDFFTNQGMLKDGVTNNVQITLKDGSSANMNFQMITQKIVSYNGDMEKFSMVKMNGAVEPSSDTVNATGEDLFGSDIFDNSESGNVTSGCAMINNMLTVLAKTEAHDSHWMTSDGITISNVSDSTILVAETHLGARSQLYDNVLTMLENQNDNIVDNITDISSTDVAKLAIDLMQAQTLYSMSLSLGGRILPLSLADYL